MFDPQHLIDALPGAIFTAGLVWGTVRAELAALNARVREAKADAERAHSRIDQHLEHHT